MQRRWYGGLLTASGPVKHNETLYVHSTQPAPSAALHTRTYGAKKCTLHRPIARYQCNCALDQTVDHVRPLATKWKTQQPFL